MEVLRVAHSTPFGGHIYINKTTQRIASLYYFPKMKQKVADYIRCHQCQTVAGLRVAECQPLQRIQVMDTYPFEDISIDVLCGELPQTPRRNKFVLTIVCNVSKWWKPYL